MTDETTQADIDGGPSLAERTTGVLSDAGAAAGSVLSDATSAAGAALNQLADATPEVVAASRRTVDETIEGLRATPTAGLALGAAFCAGLTVGLLLGRAPRPLIALTLGPTLAFGGTLLSRLPVFESRVTRIS
ncbi:MAG: hypothetical protein U0869_10755 [Chloroflexota bacterium]